MKRWIVNLLMLLVGISAFAQSSPTEKLDELMKAYVANGKFNGSVLVALKGNILLEKGYGFKVAQTKEWNDANSIFQIGSLTKQFTSAIIMQLQQEGKLSVQDKLSKYFPSLPNANKITLENLLTHTSGLYNYTNDSTIMNGDMAKHYSKEDMLSRFAKYPADFEPGTKWNYSNTGYFVLGYIIEKVTGKQYEKVVRERLFQPLNMTHSGFDFISLKDKNKTQGYFTVAATKPLVAPIVDSTIAYSAGAIYTTVGDLYKWERSISTNKILSGDSWKKIFTPFKNKYGYGWIMDSLYGKPFATHNGGIHGYTSHLIRYPQDDLVIILIDNASSASLNKIGHDLTAIVFDKPYQLPEAVKELKLPAETLKHYVGTYELAPTFVITVSMDGDRLMAQATGQPSFELFAKSETVFFLKVVEAQVEFNKDAMGAVTGLVLHQNGQDIKGNKIK